MKTLPCQQCDQIDIVWTLDFLDVFRQRYISRPIVPLHVSYRVWPRCMPSSVRRRRASSISPHHHHHLLFSIDLDNRQMILVVRRIRQIQITIEQTTRSIEKLFVLAIEQSSQRTHLNGNLIRKKTYCDSWSFNGLVSYSNWMPPCKWNIVSRSIGKMSDECFFE